MSDESERLKRLVALKKRIENKVEETSSEMKELQALLETINSLLIEKGFKHISTADQSTKTEPVQRPQRTEEGEPQPILHPFQAESESVTPLKAADGELLAQLYERGASLRVVLADDKNFDIKTSPFMHFLVERVLLKMQERDDELARAGQLSPDKIFCYSIVRDGDTIREIDINNSDPGRVRELKSSIRWTLEKMYEKPRSQP